MVENKVPFELGYSMPAEWETHDATWLSWPKDPDSFPEEILPEVENTYVQMIGALHTGEEVHVLVDDEYFENRAKKALESKGITLDNIFFHRIQTADVWFRDYGPIFVLKKSGSKKEIAFTHWKFNAWGDKYEDLKNDSKVPNLMPIKKIKGFEIPIVLEGGSIDLNGLGTCLTTEQCLLNKNRNPNLSRNEIENYLKDYLGATNVIWLKEGLEGDDTDGHVDDLARFVSIDTVVCGVEEDPKDKNYSPLKKNLEILKNSKDQDGKNLNVIQLPMPKAVVYLDQRLPASYTNFYIGNKVVLVPIFKDNNDKKALSVLEKLFPGRKVIGINCRELVYGFGAIHCVTQQQPRC